MKRLLRLSAVIAALASAGHLFTRPVFASPVTNATDISYVVGSGSNRANLVIDFQDGKTRESFAWGFLFNGADVSGADMLLAVAAADAHLTLDHGGTGADGFFITSITYFDGTDAHSRVNDFGATPAVSWGYYVDGGLSGGSALAGGGSTLPSSWQSSGTGASDESFGSPGRLLTDGAWDAWSFGELDGTTFAHQDPPSGTVHAAVPEPSVFAAVVLGGLLVLRFWRSRAGGVGE